MTKKVTGIAKLKKMPDINSRPVRKVTRIGTFYNGDDAITSLLLEVADTEDSRRNGLMGREAIPDICGMLFEGLSGGGNFWMKNCLIPLDVAFMDNVGVIKGISSMPVDKEGKKRYEYDDDVTSALEVNMGLLDRLGIKKGFRLETRKLKGGSDG